MDYVDENIGIDNSRLEEVMAKEITGETQREFFELLKKALKIIPKNVVIHRLTGDPPKKILIAPAWTKNKKLVLSRINNLLCDYERL